MSEFNGIYRSPVIDTLYQVTWDEDLGYRVRTKSTLMDQDTIQWMRRNESGDAFTTNPRCADITPYWELPLSWRVDDDVDSMDYAEHVKFQPDGRSQDARCIELIKKHGLSNVSFHIVATDRYVRLLEENVEAIIADLADTHKVTEKEYRDLWQRGSFLTPKVGKQVYLTLQSISCMEHVVTAVTMC